MLHTFDQNNQQAIMDASPLWARTGGRYQVSSGKRFDHGNRFPLPSSDGKVFVDSTGAFLIGELERIDMTMHDPLVAVTWGRDIDLREDVTIADEVSSFTTSTYGSAGGLGAGNSIGNGKAWIGKETTQISGISLDIAKTTHVLRPWGLEVKFDILELESAARVGRPVDEQKFAGLKLKHQMDIDEQVYIGDTSTGDTGLLNASGVTVTNVPAGASGFTTWINKSPLEVLNDVNNALISVWAAAGYAVMPNRILIPPTQYGYLATTPVTLAGTQSILNYVLENNIIARSVGKGQLQINPCKWNVGAGAGGTIGTTGTVDRMCVYTKDKERVRYPMTLLNRTPVQFDGLFHKMTYFCRLGILEVVYSQTIGYFDGI